MKASDWKWKYRKEHAVYLEAKRIARLRGLKDIDEVLRRVYEPPASNKQ